MEDLVEWIDKQMEEFAKELGLRLMTDEEWEKFKTKRQKGTVTGTITFLKGESARKAAERFKKKLNDDVQKRKGECVELMCPQKYFV